MLKYEYDSKYRKYDKHYDTLFVCKPSAKFQMSALKTLWGINYTK